jgi:hypothetical protein
MTFLIHNLEYFSFNFSIHNVNTRKKLQLHRPIANLASYLRGAYYANIKIFNSLPVSLAQFVTDKKYFLSVIGLLTLEDGTDTFS